MGIPKQTKSETAAKKSNNTKSEAQILKKVSKGSVKKETKKSGPIPKKNKKEILAMDIEPKEKAVSGVKKKSVAAPLKSVKEEKTSASANRKVKVSEEAESKSPKEKKTDANPSKAAVFENKKNQTEAKMEIKAAPVHHAPMEESAAAFQASSPQPMWEAPVHTQPQTQNYQEWKDHYHEARLQLMVRDPYWCFAYWDLNQWLRDEIRRETQEIAPEQRARLVLRLYDVSNLDFNGLNAHRYADIDVHAFVRNWYVNVWESDRAYCVDLGLLYPSGHFRMLLRSNIIQMPRDGVSSVIDEHWMVIDEFDKMYMKGLGGASESIFQYMLKNIHADVTSGGLASMGSEGGRPRLLREDFWLKVETELIVYGATEPSANVSIQGRQIKLNPDGSFALRFALPDGQQRIDVKAVNSQGNQERQITPVVNKYTE